MTKENLIALLNSQKYGAYKILLFEFQEAASKMGPYQLKLYIETTLGLTDSEKELIKKESLKSAKRAWLKKTRVKGEKTSTPKNWNFLNADETKEENHKRNFFK
jgi:hypothetical protein